MAELRRAAPLDGVRNLRLKLLVLAVLCVLPGLGAARMAWLDQAWWPLALYPAMSLVSVMLYWQDKHQARQQAWRTPEKVLHASELLGGWPGALLAQQLFRHKTRKLSYQLLFWAIVLLHQVFWVDWLFFGGRFLPLG
ncbi:DUF1294 domain-containing protein [Pseudomonas juntendi]|jgi:uncharacterized membrane protein YsdA (DUF1294 family)|uniref:DUF1294 domain-containing protein n=1 Tax=Pseudomonas juntendi TaxID=2666183 RepID=A0ABD4YF46_9PSED|nr:MULTISPECIES: DUF1294 domain-containing protein [Pseudomonas]MBH3371769.1 DUF1294 domain-containing protein [Pseudomonas juntendi]MBS6036105.1 DUF1294 domain-containing protein [Pseudomonas sp.]MDG9872932.1 DUF1294 domain-containing protein [Pseudomonas juntendi]MDH0757203.1 DUF1294 domain-containing protein [Pseudomonas juntendi]MDH1918146.1 DUF1294 domain-containing protein [Pseudomonas juntendi]